MKIIYLNGVSSSGKTTLAKTLQQKLLMPYYWLSEDVFRSMTPEKFDNEDDDECGWAWINSIIAMYHASRMYSDLGMNVIIDTVFDEDLWVNAVFSNP